jgi:hypothetical protein
MLMLNAEEGAQTLQAQPDMPVSQASPLPRGIMANR